MQDYWRSPMSPFMRICSYSLSGMLLALTTALIMEGAFSLPLIPAWLISINIFTLIFYWIDKINSVYVGENEKRSALKARIPEPALLLLALVGGSPAAILMILILPHKTNSCGFLVWFGLIVAAQVAAVLYFWSELPWA